MTRLGSRIDRRLTARVRFSSWLSRRVQPGAGFFQNRKFMWVIHNSSRTSWVLLLLLGSCHIDRPIHPLRLDGFPGAPVVDNLFPLRDGTSWTFEDRLDPEAPRLVLTLRRAPFGKFFLEGARRADKVEIAWNGEFLELSREGQLIDRILKYPGKAGETWVVNQAIFTVFGYDTVKILGEKRRALVVAADRRQMREIGWFVPDMGWVRIRTEHRGRPIHDTFLVAYEPGRMN
jgi:hypothetical protein